MSTAMTEEEIRIHRKAVFRNNMWPKMRVNAVYYESNSVRGHRLPTEFEYSYLNHVNFGFSRLQPDGSILLGDEFLDCEIPIMECTGCIGVLLSMKKTFPHLRVCISIGGPESDANFPAVAADPEKRKVFAQAAVEMVRSSGFDGIDIVWRYPSSSAHGKDFLELLREVEREFKPDNYILTVLLPGSRAVLELLDLKEMSNVVDLLSLACYNFFDYNEVVGPNVSCHASQLYSTDDANQSSVMSIVHSVLNRGVSSHKILLGVPAYGQRFVGCLTLGAPCSGWELVEYRDIPKNGTEVVDTAAVAATCMFGNGEIISYDNVATVRTKAEFCLESNLAGMFYWMGPYDSSTRHTSLIKAGFDVLHMDPDHL